MAGESRGDHYSGAAVGGRAGTANHCVRTGAAVAFIQVIELLTNDLDAVRRVDEEWRRGTEGKRTARREIITRDRSDPGRYFVLVFFDSYESAMENSSLPETQAAADQFTKFSVGPPVFYDLDVLEDHT
jgi:hypothetical protein